MVKIPLIGRLSLREYVVLSFGRKSASAVYEVRRLTVTPQYYF
jgi:hypothetical protein